MVKMLVGGKNSDVENSAERMMREFVNEGLVQREFDFGMPAKAGARPAENPDDYKQEMMEIAADAYEERTAEEKWFPVYDAIEAAKAKVKGVKTVNGGIDALTAYRGVLPAVSVWHDGGSTMVSERMIMEDPLDSDLYEKHLDLLGQLAANMPKGFEADFGCRPGTQNKYIGDKYIVAKEQETESDQYGTETYVTYDVIETLRISAIDDKDKSADLQETIEQEFAADTEDDCIEVDFPAWALDYMVNAEIGSVSRLERYQIDAWRQMMGMNGYDVSLANYGQEEYFSSSPEFGRPCDCVTAKIPLKQNKLNESAGDIIRVLCVTGAEFEDDYAEQRAWASREGEASVAEETEKDRAKAENFKFPVYSNIAFPAFMTEWFYDSDLFEAHRNEIEARALPVWNSLNGFKFVKAVSLEFEDATDDMLAESDDPVSKYLDGIGLISEQEGVQRLYRISARAYTVDEDPYSPSQAEYRYDCWAMSPREAAQIAARNFMGDFNDAVQLAKPMTDDWDGLVDDLVVTDEDGRDVTREFQHEFDRLCRDYARQIWG